MTKIFKRSAALMAIFIAIVMCFTVVAPLAACGGPTLDPLQIEELNKATAEINVGDTLTLKARTNRDPEEDEVIVWSSDKTAVATVDDNGKVKGVSEGEATITATYNETSASCKVTVTLRREITLDKTTATLDCDIAEQLTLTATASKGGEVDNAATITWKSSDDKVATVVNGVVTAKGQGNAVITATYEGVAASCNVQVVSYNAPYTVERGATNATIANTPGIWFYFLKTSDGVAAYEGENITRSVENGKEKIDAEFAKIEILEGQELNNMQFYLRYMPNFALETPYVVSFKFVANVDGRVEIGQNTRVEFTANEEVEVSAQMTVTQGMPLNIKLFMVGENVKFTLTGITFTEVTGQPEPNPDPNPNPNPNPDPEPNPEPEPQPTVEYEDVAVQHSAMAGESWYVFGATDAVSGISQDGKIVITSATPARMDLFKVDATPTNGADGDWVNLADKTDNFASAGTAFYGYEYIYDMTVATTGEFSLVLFGTSGTPAIFNGTTHRAVYLFFTDGKVELKQSGTGKDAVQASATYNGTVAGITSLRLSVTRVNDTDIVLKVYVNGTKLVMSGSPTTGKISAAGDYVDRIVTATNGYGQRFGVVPAEGNTFTISAANVQRSKTTVAAPELVELTTETAKLVLEGDKVYLVIEGSYTGPDAAAKAEVAATLIDLQQMNLWGYPVSGQAKSEAKDGKFSIYLDITSLEVNDAENYYFGHFGSGNLDSCGLTTDTAALTVTANGKVYTLGRNGNDLTDAWKRGLITINVTAA